METVEKPTLSGCDVLPPMNPGEKSHSDSASQKSRRKRSTRDRFAVLNNFVDFTLKSVNRSQAAVWLVLYRDTKNEIAATAQSDIARRAGLDRRSVCRALKRLEELGLVHVVYRGGLNRGHSKYRVFPLIRDGDTGRPRHKHV